MGSRSPQHEQLKALHNRERSLRPGHREQLEAELVTRYSRTIANRQGGWTMFQGMNMRWVSIGLVLVLGVVACAMPTSSEVELGQQVQMAVDLQQDDPAAARALFAKTNEMVASLTARPEIDDASVSVNLVADDDKATATLSMQLWGKDIDLDRVVSEMQAQMPELAGASVSSTPLKTEVRESFAQKIGREVLSIEVGMASEDEMRAQILAQLAENGFDGDSDVQVSRDGDMTTIGLTLSGEGMETEQVIEIIGAGPDDEIEIPMGEDVDAADGAEVHREVYKVKGDQ